MNNKITEMFGNISEEEYSLFNEKASSNLEYVRSTLNVSRDFSWIPIVEETLPYLDYIIRNPKKFLQQEDDIVIVEKSKKISTETVMHLAQHTNFIQDVDDDGSVKPSKVLNVEKEDTWDIYENRFIYTLVKELTTFIDKYADKELESPREEISSNLSYVGKTTYDNEDINITLNINTNKVQEPEDFNKEENKKKILEIRDIVYGFEKSDFIKSLSQAIPVKSPIKKTNIILKDPNFQKALVLWEYIKDCDIGNPQLVKKHEENLTSKSIRQKFDLTYFLDYYGMTHLISDNEIGKESLEDKLLSLIEEYVDISGYTEKKIGDFITNEVKSAIKKRKQRNVEIKDIYSQYISNNNRYIKNICNLM